MIRYSRRLAALQGLAATYSIPPPAPLATLRQGQVIVPPPPPGVVATVAAASIPPPAPPPPEPAKAVYIPPPPPAPTPAPVTATIAASSATQIAVEKAIASGAATVVTDTAGSTFVKTPVATIINPEREVLARDPEVGKAVVALVETKATPTTSTGSAPDLRPIYRELDALKDDVKTARAEARDAYRAAQSISDALREVQGQIQQAASAVGQLDEAASAKFEAIEKTIAAVRSTLMEMSSRALLRKAPITDLFKKKPAPTVQGVPSRPARGVVVKDDDDDDDTDLN